MTHLPPPTTSCDSRHTGCSTARSTGTVHRSGITLAAALAAMATVAACSSAPTTTTANPATSARASSATSSTSTSTPPASTSSATTSPTPAPSSTLPPSPTPTTDPTTSTTTPTATPTPAGLTLGDTGDQVRALQHRLRQLSWLSGPITGTFEDDTLAAVTGFQNKRGLPATGAADAATMAKLVAMTTTPTHDDMYNILRPGPAIYQAGMSSPKVREMQARLKQIGWYAGDVVDSYGPKTVAAVKGFQGKRGFPVTGEIDQRTLDSLVARTHAPSSDELTNVVPKPAGQPAPAVLDPRCLTGKVICINKTTRKLSWVVDGKALLTMSARFGPPNEATREGTFTVYFKSKDWVSKLYDSPMPYSLFFSGGQAVHYSYSFARLGYNGNSHGCVNVRNWNGLVWLYSQAPVGTKVVVYR